jgi:hypothetical protein
LQEEETVTDKRPKTTHPAAIADCDDNNVERGGFDCIAIAANDIEIETSEEEPPEESATLSVCKVAQGSLEPEDFTFTVTGNGHFPDQFTANNGDCVDATIGPGEYTVTEAAVSGVTNFGTEITGDCVDEDPANGNSRTATGEIQAGETQECRFRNFQD